MSVNVEIYEFFRASACCGPGSSCCGPSTATESEIIEALLQQEFGDGLNIKRIDLTTTNELPLAVEEALREHGATIEPLTVVNGALMAEGSLPNLEEFIRIIRENMER